MELNLHFPTVIGSLYNKELQEKMVSVVNDILANDEYLTYEWGYKNTYTGFSGIDQLPQMTEFVDFLKETCSNYLQNLGYAPMELNPSIFASQMFKGDRHPRHCHSNSTLSGVFYLDCPTGSSDIVFYDPRNFRDVRSLHKLETNTMNAEAIRYTPQPGMLLLWESWIHHEVLENQSETGRTTLVFNA